MGKSYQRATKRRKKREDEKNTKVIETRGFIEPGKGLTISLEGDRMVTLPPYVAPWTAFVEADLSEDVKSALELDTKVFLNSRYQVCVTENVPMHNGASHCTWLNITRHDKESCHDSRDFQRIKNELCGPEREGLYLYPAESRLVDGSNQYHIWVFPEGITIPVGFLERIIMGEKGDGLESTEIPVGNGQTAKQRTFEDLPEDAYSADDATAILDADSAQDSAVK